MKTKHFIRNCILAIMISGLFWSSSVAKVLDVPVIGQKMSNWCWAATSEALFKYHGQTDASQNYIVSTIKGSEVNQTGNANEIIQALGLYCNLNPSYMQSNLSEAQVKQEADQGHPFMMGWFWSQGGGHALIYSGYNESGSHRLVDPWPVNSGDERWLTHNALINAEGKGNWGWTFKTNYASTKEEIELKSLNNGEMYTQGQTVSITWETTVSDLLTIQLYNDGSMVKTIASNVSATTGSYSWYIDDDLADSKGYSVTIMKSGDESISDESDMDFTINTIPEFVSDPVTNAQEEVSYTYNIEVTDKNLSDLEISAEYLPDGLEFTDKGYGKATISGKPEEFGDFDIEISVTDGIIDEAIVQSYTLVVDKMTKISHNSEIQAPLTTGTLLISPNPVFKANGSVTFFFDKITTTAATLIIFDPLGNIIDQQSIPVGSTSATWDLISNNTQSVQAGSYCAVLNYTDKAGAKRAKALFGIKK